MKMMREPLCTACVMRLCDKCIGCLCDHGDPVEMGAQDLARTMARWRQLFGDRLYAESLVHFEALRAMLPVPVRTPDTRR